MCDLCLYFCLVGMQGVTEYLGNMEDRSPTKKSKSKGKAGVDYDVSRFTEKMRKNCSIRSGFVTGQHLRGSLI